MKLCFHKRPSFWVFPVAGIPHSYRGTKELPGSKLQTNSGVQADSSADSFQLDDIPDEMVEHAGSIHIKKTDLET